MPASTQCTLSRLPRIGLTARITTRSYERLTIRPRFASSLVTSPLPRRSAATASTTCARSFTSTPRPRADSASSPPASQAPVADPHLTPPDYLSAAELLIFEKLRAQLQPVKLEVQDISGGCGSMYGLDIVSPRFNGMSVIKQHQLVNSVLKEEIKAWHGVQLKTKPAA